MNNAVFITGASRGIGAAAARLLCKKGWRVCIGYNSCKAVAEDLTESLIRAGGEAFAVKIDITDPESVAAAAELAKKQYNFISAVINNAGIAQQKMFCDITEADWGNMINTDLSGAFRVTKAFLPDMISRKQGCIVNIASMWGQTGGSCEVHYSAAKGGVIAMTKALAKEVGPSGIRVNCIAPGVVETDMLAAFSSEDKKALAEESALCRNGTPEEIAKAAAFLLSDDASFITGQVLGVNGGILI